MQERTNATGKDSALGARSPGFQSQPSHHIAVSPTWCFLHFLMCKMRPLDAMVSKGVNSCDSMIQGPLLKQHHDVGKAVVPALKHAYCTLGNQVMELVRSQDVPLREFQKGVCLVSGKQVALVVVSSPLWLCVHGASRLIPLVSGNQCGSLESMLDLESEEPSLDEPGSSAWCLCDLGLLTDPL